jgi:pSer/pThr/pTyr-binding forkhead associated (FHA) protein
MAQLRCYLKGELLQTLEIDQGREYIIGRAETCDLILNPEPGISRQHLKLSWNQLWRVEVLSRYGELYTDGRRVSSIDLALGQKFSVPPYEFEFSDHTADQPLTPLEAPQEFDFSDKTYVGGPQIAVYLKVYNELGDNVHIFKLEGHSWIAGRDTSCNIFIDHQKFSRKQFEMRQEEGAYMIRDLGSSNGTMLNGQALPIEWTTLQSGDQIQVGDWVVAFEVRDEFFDQRWAGVRDLQRAPVIFESNDSENYPAPVSEPRFPNYHQGPKLAYDPNAYYPPSPAAGKKSGLNPIRLLIMVLVIGGGLFYFTQPSPSTEKVAQQKSSSNPFDKLTPEKQQYVKDTYRLADSLFKQGRYELARQEIAKIHELVPFFQESKNLEQLADVAIQTQIDQQKVEEKERQAREMEEKIAAKVVECRPLVSRKSSMEALDNCLGSVVVLNPDHPEIINLKMKMDEILTRRSIAAQRSAEYQSQVRRRKALYEKALGVLNSGDQIAAIPAFEAVIKSSLPDPENLKALARRQINQIQQGLADSQSGFQRQADEAYRKGDLKSAYQTLQKALKINAENEVIKGRMRNIMIELRKQMQSYYQEGVLEESVGEVESAKSKWKKIRELSVPEEEYYKKSTIKLKRYGSL